MDTLARTRLLVGTTQDWLDDDIVCGDGELVIERTPGGLPRAKVGDGASQFSSLKYLGAAPTTAPLLYKGARDFTLAAPSGALAGDMWANTNAGVAHASWIGFAGQSVNQYDLGAFDGARWDIIGSADPVLRDELLSTTDPTNGAGAVSLNPQLTYPNNSMGAHDSDTVRVVDYPYLARGAGVTDDTAKIQAAITWAGAAYDADWWSSTLYARPRIVELSNTHKVLGKLLVPRGVIVRGQNTTLIGSGSGSGDNICFESAYFNGSVLTSNIGTPNETHRLMYTVIEAIRFVNFKIAVNWFNANEGCALHDCAFQNCGQNAIAERCWYAQFYNLMSRGPATAALAAYEFRQYVNVMRIENIYVQGRTAAGALAYLFTGGVNGLSLRNLSAESCTNGLKFTGEVNPLNIDSCYFENVTGVAIDLTTALAHRALSVDNCWFNNVATAFSGVQLISGRIGAGNYFLATTNPVVISDKSSSITVEVPPAKYAAGPTGGVPTLPAGYSVTRSQRVVAPRDIYDTGTGDSVARQDFTGGLVPLPFAGLQAAPPANTVPFCTHSKTAGTTFDIIIDTGIVYDPFVMWIFSLQFSDNGGTYNSFGRGYGLTAFIETGSSAKTVTVTNNGGYLRLQWTSFTHPSSVYSCKGVIRMQ